MTPEQRHDRETAWGFISLLLFAAAIAISIALNFQEVHR